MAILQSFLPAMPHRLVIGGTREERLRFARGAEAGAPAIPLDTRTLPFVRPEDIQMPPAPRVIVLEDAERAFPDAQAGGTRLVLTQSTYLVQKWVDRLGADDRIIATADRAVLERCAPEALQGRGAWEAFAILDLDSSSHQSSVVSHQSSVVSPQLPAPSPLVETLAQAFAAPSSEERLQLCQGATQSDPSSGVAWLALASACRETRDGDAARDALTRAAALAPEWEAIAYESGKLWLVHDDMAQARDAFQRAADLMPTFSAACSNLGATLGELDEPAAALKAFRQALAHDLRSFTILNNIGVVCRELGRLDESEAAFRGVIEINPAFVFGHYNLGHTLFLAGTYPEALGAYEEGQRRDPQQSRRQGCRLAVVRFANGDIPGAERDLWRCVDTAPPDEREDLLLEAYEIARALLTQHPALEQRAFLDRIGAEITKSE